MPHLIPRWIGAFLCAAAAVWAVIPGDARAVDCRDRKPTTWDIEVAPATEPGERLVLSGHVVSRAGRAPLAGVTVYVYHADAKGEYNRPGHEREAPRLCGVLRTNRGGEYRIRTSMPGGYEGFLPHVHFEVWGPRVQRQMLFVNLKPKAVVMDTSRALLLPGSAPALRDDITANTRPVYRGEGGVLHCGYDLAVDAR